MPSQHRVWLSKKINYSVRKSGPSPYWHSVHRAPNDETGIEAYLTGTYLTVSEFIYRRRFSFPKGVAKGDLIMFPNTAGYLMHFLESRSHQFDLAKNIFLQGDGIFLLDDIDGAEAA